MSGPFFPLLDSQHFYSLGNLPRLGHQFCFIYSRLSDKNNLQVTFFLNNFLIYFWPCWVFIAPPAFLQLWWTGSTLVAVHRLLKAVASFVAEPGLQGACTQQLQFLGSRAQAQQLWCTRLVALYHTRSFWTRYQTHVSCIGRLILYH